MGLFETPLVLGILALALLVFVAVRWRNRRNDEWRKESAPPVPADSGSPRKSNERP